VVELAGTITDPGTVTLELLLASVTPVAVAGALLSVTVQFADP